MKKGLDRFVDKKIYIYNLGCLYITGFLKRISNNGFLLMEDWPIKKEARELYICKNMLTRKKLYVRRCSEGCSHKYHYEFVLAQQHLVALCFIF